MTANADFVRTYLAALSALTTGPALAKFFHPEVQQVEFPNRLVPTGARRDLRALLEGAERGSKVTRAQSYVITIWSKRATPWWPSSTGGRS